MTTESEQQLENNEKARTEMPSIPPVATIPFPGGQPMRRIVQEVASTEAPPQTMEEQQPLSKEVRDSVLRTFTMVENSLLRERQAVRELAETSALLHQMEIRNSELQSTIESLHTDIEVAKAATNEEVRKRIFAESVLRQLIVTGSDALQRGASGG